MADAPGRDDQLSYLGKLLIHPEPVAAPDELWARAAVGPVPGQLVLLAGLAFHGGWATVADASLNRRMTVRLADAVAFAQIGIVGRDGQIELEALRLYGLPEAAPALLYGTPTLPVGQREFAAEIPLDLPSLAAGAVHLVGVTVAGARQGDRAEASLASSTRFIELDAFTWTTNTVRVMARNVSGSTFDPGAATLSVAVTKRRVS